MVGWHHQLNGCKFEQTLGDGEGQGRLACCSPWGHRELDTTQQLNKNTKGRKLIFTEYLPGIKLILGTILNNTSFNPYKHPTRMQALLHPFHESENQSSECNAQKHTASKQSYNLKVVLKKSHQSNYTTKWELYICLLVLFHCVNHIFPFITMV